MINILNSKNRNLFLFIILYLLSVITFYLYIEDDKQFRINTVFEKSILNIHTHYMDFLFDKSQLADMIHQQTIQDTTALNLCTQAYQSQEDSEKLKTIRDELQTHLQKSYNIYKTNNILQYQFVFPNNKAFLRMHKAEKFGDDLSGVREDYVVVNKALLPIKGLMQGRTSHGFRNVYPLFDKDGNHIGAFEISFASKILQSYLNDVSNLYSHFLIDKNIFDAKVWSHDNLLLDYKQSIEHSSYMMHSESKYMGSNYICTAQELEPVKESIYNNIAKGKSFAEYLYIDNKIQVMTFYPIKQSVSKEVIAWIVSYSDNNEIEEILSNAKIIQFLFVIILFTILWFLHKNLIQSNKLIELKERFELAFNGVNDGLWDWDISNNRVYYSPVWETMLGYRVGELENSLEAFFSLIHKDDKENLQNTLNEHFKDPQNNIYFIEMRLLCKDGSYKWILARGKATLDKAKNPYRMVGSHTDISKKIEFQNRLKEAKENADKSNKAKSEFLANMSHEIRTPLNAIIGFIEILQERETDITKQKYLDIVNSSSKNLIELINDILDFSKIESGNIEIEHIDFDPLKEFSLTRKLFQAKFKEKNIKFYPSYLDMPPSLNGDVLRIKQVINNLLSNAIKFTDKNKIVYLDITYRDANLYVKVRDEGIGISQLYQEKIFEAFTQEDSSTTRKYGGTGLGLTISYNLVKAMGGELKVKSVLGKGSEFYFSLPLLAGKEIKEIVSIEENTLFKNKKILLVEDNKANQMFMKVVLKKLSLEFDIANDGLEAIDKFKNSSYDAILMDENMPNMNGIEATQQIIKIEKEKELKHTPIIALTANALKGDRDRFLSSGMDEYLSKPLNKKKLLEVLGKFLEDNNESN